MAECLCDNDIVYKLSRWDFLKHLAKAYGLETCNFAVLGSLRYVLSAKLNKKGTHAQKELLDKFLGSSVVIEPSDDEILLSAEIESLSIERNLDLDAGESLIFAIAILRETRFVLTGDKRAIASLPAASTSISRIATLKGRIETLEAVIAKLINELGLPSIKAAVCNDRDCDRSITSCMGCSSASADLESTLQGLVSYQKDLAARSNGFCSASLIC